MTPAVRQLLVHGEAAHEASVTLVAGDAASQECATMLMTGAAAGRQPIVGVLHAGGVLADATIVHQVSAGAGAYPTRLTAAI